MPKLTLKTLESKMNLVIRRFENFLNVTDPEDIYQERIDLLVRKVNDLERKLLLLDRVTDRAIDICIEDKV
jgi:uncharacterized protein YllA (UPF0747 family)